MSALRTPAQEREISRRLRTPEQEATWQRYLRDALADREDAETRAGNAYLAHMESDR